MKIEMHTLECQHPFGPYIHVVMPDKREILNALLTGFDLRDIIDRDLLRLEKLAKENLPAQKCTAYKLAMDEDAWAVVALRAKINNVFSIRALFVRIDPQCPIEGVEIIEMMRLELMKATIKYGDK